MDLANTSLGLWVDSPRRDVLNEEFFFAVVKEELKFDLIAVIIDRSNKDSTFSYKPKHVKRLLELADQEAIEVVLTTCPFPDKSQIDQQVEQMMDLMQVGPVAAWEVNLEFNWKPELVEGFSDLNEAGEHLVEEMKEVCDIQGARIEMTTGAASYFTFYLENSRKANVGLEADRLLVQAYSVDKRRNKPVAWNNKFGPGNMQDFTLTRTLNIPGATSSRLGVGLAAWAQQFQGHPPAEAMRSALEASLKYNPIDIRWWSSKHIIDVNTLRANSYALNFLKTLRNTP